MKDPGKIHSWKMFNRIAKTYDLVNLMLSFGLDTLWRKKVGSLVPKRPGLAVLDLATGTGDQIISLWNSCSPNIEKGMGMDLSEGMLDIGRRKIEEKKLQDVIGMEVGDATDIPAEAASYDAVTISFGIRNVPDVPASLREMHRILRPSGKALILEFSMPSNPVVRWGHLFYLRHVLPLVGGAVSGDFEAYRYLNTSIESFPYGRDFCRLMEDAGFDTVVAHPVSLGIATIYEGVR
jgi:demethylmenaquinone methyltransferase / 2-methoxy-6-polyprenyl-1,4-benzoquinol methylase